MTGYSKVSVELHKNDIYYLRYPYNGERRLVSTRTDNPGQAELLRRKMEDLLAEGKDPRIEQEQARRLGQLDHMTLRDIWPEIESRHLRDKALKTISLYRGNFENLSKYLINGTSLVDLPMKEISKQMVNGYIDLRLEQGRKPATINRDLQFLSVALHFAVENEYLAVLPVQIKKLKEDNRRDVSNIRPEQIAELITHLPAGVAAIVEFLAYTGRRLNEVLTLRIEDVWRIDLPTPYLVARFKVKGGQVRTFPLSDLAAEVFERVRNSRTEGYAFLAPSGDRYKSIHKTLDGWVRYLGITIVGGAKLCTHDLRRLFATWAAQAQRSMPEIAEALGHSNATITKRYTPGREVPQEFYRGQKRLREAR